MTLNENTIKGKWLEIRGEVQKAWGKLTNDELDKTKGDMKAVEGLIQQRYGKTQDSSSSKLSDIYKKYLSCNETPIETAITPKEQEYFDYLAKYSCALTAAQESLLT